MQPEPNETFKKDSLNSSPSGPSSFTNHGLPQHSLEPSFQLYAEEGKHWPQPPSTSRTPSETSSEGSGRLSGTTSRGLSGPRRHAGSPVDRISEHEKALTRSTRKRRGGPDFDVVQRPRKPDSSGVEISDFPNGEMSERTRHIGTNVLEQRY